MSGPMSARPQLLTLFAFALGCGSEPTRVVEPLYPGQDWTVSDVAVTFSWNRPNRFRSRDDRWTTNRFRLQVARDANFNQLVFDEKRMAVGQDRTGFEAADSYPEVMLDHWRETMWMPTQLLEAGTYHWRIKALDGDGGPWSEPIGFTVTDDGSHAAPVRPLTPDDPLFTFDLYDLDGGGWGRDPREKVARVADSVPLNIRESVAFAVPHEYWGRDPAIGGVDLRYEELIEPLQERNTPFLIKTGGPDGDFQWMMPLALLEQMYMDNPNCLGVVTGENVWAFIRGWYEEGVHEKELLWLSRVIELSSRHGRTVILGEGTYDFTMEKFLGQETPSESREEGDFEWMSPDFIQQHADTIVWAPKNNIRWSYHHADSMVFGAWLAGQTTHLGLWSEAWYWSDAGFTDVFSDEMQSQTDAAFSSMPYGMWVQMQMMSASKGATVFHFGGESGVVNDEAKYDPETDSMVWRDNGRPYPSDTAVFGMWDMDGTPMPTFTRYVAPFIEAVATEGLIPARADVLAQVHAAVIPGPPESDHGSFTCYGDYAPLYTTTYGIESWVDVPDDYTDDDFLREFKGRTGCRTELIPASGRYYWLPILPHPLTELPGTDAQTIPLARLAEPSVVRDILGDLYPAGEASSAHVIQLSDQLYVTNGEENRDRAQSFSATTDWGGGMSLSGEVQPHGYLVAGHHSGRVFIHANASHNGPYTDGRRTELLLTLATEPTIRFEPASAGQHTAYDPDSGTVSIVLRHSDGPVNVVIETTTP